MQLKRNLPRYSIAIQFLVLLLLVMACTPEGSPEPGPTAPLATSIRPTESSSGQKIPDSTATLEPVHTPEINPTTTPTQAEPLTIPTVAHRACNLATDTIDATFISDIGLADGTRLAPNTRFSKSWQVRNTGDCSWPAGTVLMLIAGDQLPGPQQIPVSQTAPGRDIAISVEFTAPARPGTYESFWRLRTPDGELFGAVLFVEITVQEGAPTLTSQPTARPTSTPTPVPPATATRRPSPTATMPPTSVPTQTPTATHTATPKSDTSSTCRAPDDRYHTIINQATALDIQVLCATGPIETVTGQIQVFRQNVEQDDPHVRYRGFLVLRDDTDKIYELSGKDVNTYQATVTTYSSAEGIPPDEEPATCSGLGIPPGYILPAGRLGATWCTYSLWVSTGWPQLPASDATLEIQETTNGLLIKATTEATDEQTEQVYVIAIDFGARRATVD